jgi:hypothetical protein
VELLDRILAEWDVIRQAPITFGTALIVAFATAYGIARLQFSDRLATASEREKFKDDRTV